MCILPDKCTQSPTSTHARTCTHFLNPLFVSALPMPLPWEKTPLRFWQLQRCWRQSRTHKWWSWSLGCVVAPSCRGIYGRIECLWCCRSLLWLMLRETWAENQNMTHMSSSNATVAERNGGFWICRSLAHLTFCDRSVCWCQAATRFPITDLPSMSASSFGSHWQPLFLWRPRVADAALQ